MAAEFTAHKADVAQEAQVVELEHLGVDIVEDVQHGERPHHGVDPLVGDADNIVSPHDTGLVGGAGAVDGHVVVGAADLVLGAVEALRKGFVAADVAALAGIAALAGLGVASRS